MNIANLSSRSLSSLLAIIVGNSLLTVSVTFAQLPTAQPVSSHAAALAGEDADLPLSEQVGLVAAVVPQPLSLPVAPPVRAGSDEHPLMPVLRWAEQDLPAIEKLKDYSATLVRRERIRGTLSRYEYMSIKVRHEPFSVYALFQAPAGVKGQEVLYVAGRNQGNMWAHKDGMATTVSIHPTGMIAMNDRHYPITEIGLVNLVRRLVDVGREDVRHGECEVKYFNGVKLNDRECTVIQVVHPAPRDVFRFHLARIFVDNELKVPIRYESHDWPDKPGESPKLIEEYTYLDLKLNNGFTDEDFSTWNPQYNFPRAATERERVAETSR